MLSKARSELWSSIRDNSTRDPMKSDYLVEVQLRIVGWTKVYADRNEVCRLGQTVYNHPNGVKILDFYLVFTLHLTIYHARYYLRKDPYKSRSLTIHLLTMILLALRMILLLLTLKPSIPQFSTQLMCHTRF